MSKKDFDAYFKSVSSDYHNMLLELQDMSKEFEQGVVSPELYEKMKTIIEPLKRNYEVLNYVDYLLNKPVKRKKHIQYNRQCKKKLTECVTGSAISEENAAVINKLRTLF